MQLHQLTRDNPNRSRKRVGRGGKRGKTSGRGTKGQKARAGHKIRPEFRDTLKKVPKLRGHGKNRARGVNSSKEKPSIINLHAINNFFDKDTEINPSFLVEAGIVKRSGGRIPEIKLLGDGQMDRAIKISGCAVSANAREKIEKAGGTIS